MVEMGLKPNFEQTSLKKIPSLEILMVHTTLTNNLPIMLAPPKKNQSKFQH